MVDSCSLETPSDFTQMLQSLFETKEKVELIVDDGGWDRASGLIMEIDLNKGTIVLDNAQNIQIEEIAAVNGVFKLGSTC